MSSLADSLVASSSRPIGLRCRPDLSARRHRYQGRSYWVVKEPVGLRYFRFQDEEYAVLRMMDGKVSLDDVKERFEAEFKPHKITLQDLQQFIGTLHRSGLVLSDAPGQGSQLKKRRDKRKKQELMGRLSNILAVRFKGIDPERILNFIYPYTRWFFSPTFVALAACFALSALLLVTIQFDVFRSRLPAFEEFFGPKNWLWLGITLGVTKVLHEFGHGLLCKHFGGECHEMGVMFLVLTPCLYCNVSDSWMLPSKWQRAAIGAGGIYVELVLASIATFVWWHTDPGGLTNNLALRVMFICSISTVLFNGNPLLRFDGYYIMSDIVEIPNLRQKASKILQRVMGKVCLGLDMPEDPFLPQRNHAFFAIYTIAAIVYRWFIFFSILFFLNKVFEPYGLKVIGQMIAMMGLFGLIVMPLYKLGKFMYVPGRMYQVKKPRVLATAGVAIAIIAGVALIPFPRNVRCAVQVRARDATPVFAKVGGYLQSCAAVGETVNEGGQLAQLENIDLEREIANLEAIVQVQELNLRTLQQQHGARDVESEFLILTAAESLVSARKQLQEKKEDWLRLSVTSPVSGTVLPPPRKAGQPPSDLNLASWTGTPLDKKNAGVPLMQGDRICQIGDPRQMEALLAIDQADIDRVIDGQNVKIKLDSLTGRTYKGQLKNLSRESMRHIDKSMSNQVGGLVATRTALTGETHPLSPTYPAVVELDNSDGALQDGLRGRAKIRIGYQTLSQRLWRYLTRTFHFHI